VGTYIYRLLRKKNNLVTRLWAGIPGFHSSQGKEFTEYEGRLNLNVDFGDPIKEASLWPFHEVLGDNKVS
jgi:hypothetical protein